MIWNEKGNALRRHTIINIPFGLCLRSEFSKRVSGDELAAEVEKVVDLTMSRELNGMSENLQ